MEVQQVFLLMKSNPIHVVLVVVAAVFASPAVLLALSLLAPYLAPAVVLAVVSALAAADHLHIIMISDTTSASYAAGCSIFPVKEEDY